jgi:hypothetical protein
VRRAPPRVANAEPAKGRTLHEQPGARLPLREDVKADVDPARVLRADGDGLLLLVFETGQLDLQVVGAWEDAAEGVGAALGGDRGLCALRRRVRERNGRAR